MKLKFLIQSSLDKCQNQEVLINEIQWVAGQIKFHHVIHWGKFKTTKFWFASQKYLKLEGKEGWTWGSSSGQ